MNETTKQTIVLCLTAIILCLIARSCIVAKWQETPTPNIEAK